MGLNESFSERLKRTISCCSIKHDNFWFSISFKSLEEAKKYRAMYPNKEIFIHQTLLYDKAEDAIAPQKLSLVVDKIES